jgi:hypothetical protein
MKQRISPYLFDDHREFIRQALKESGSSYRMFAAKHAGIISLSQLALCLSKGKAGTKSRPMRNFSPELLATLGKVFRLTEDEISYLLLLLWANNSEVLPGPYGSTYSDCLNGMLAEKKSKQFQTAIKSGAAKTRYTPTADTVAQLLDKLPAELKVKLTRDILKASKVVLSRQRHKPGVRTLTSVIDRLGELLAQGAP